MRSYRRRKKDWVFYAIVIPAIGLLPLFICSLMLLYEANDRIIELENNIVVLEERLTPKQ